MNTATEEAFHEDGLAGLTKYVNFDNNNILISFLSNSSK